MRATICSEQLGSPSSRAGPVQCWAASELPGIAALENTVCGDDQGGHHTGRSTGLS
jgi:hypothetical protein